MPSTPKTATGGRPSLAEAEAAAAKEREGAARKATARAGAAAQTVRRAFRESMTVAGGRGLADGNSTLDGGAMSWSCLFSRADVGNFGS